MFRRVAKTFRSLLGDRRGNTAIMVAIGAPLLIGSGGLAVDLGQWHLWKQELQYAVDQAAIAAAWARAEDSTKSTYATRATQEYTANLQVTKSFASTPAIALATFNGVADRAVQISATASKTLPFSGMIMKRGVTIKVEARAVAVEEGNQTACMIALDPTSSGAFTLGGNVSGNAECGWGAVSTSNSAMVKNGNSDAQAGWLVSGGGIDSGFSDNGEVHAYTSGLSDPFSGLATPNPTTSQQTRTYSCPTVTAGGTSTTANVTVYTSTTFSYRKGNRFETADSTSYSPARANETSTSGPTSQIVENGTVAGTTTTYPAPTGTKISGNGNNSIWEVATSTVQTTVSNVQQTVIPASDGTAYLQPGTYQDISIACRSIFAPGVYIVNGNLDFGQNQVVTGDGVMFVMKASEKIHINSNSNIDLVGISAEQLTDEGIDLDLAELMAGMLFHDAYSTTQLKINGNADVVLDGTLYMPNREIWFNGNSDVSGKCMMIAARKITFTGNNDLSSYCIPENATGAINIGGGRKR